MKRKDVRARVMQTGLIASVRVPSAGDALYAAETVLQAGISISEITMTVPGAVGVIFDLSRSAPDKVIGAGGVHDVETARRCIDAGASFLTTDGFVPDVVAFANREDIAVIPGALTPSEIIAAWRAGSDLVKVVPCAAAGGENYIKALKTSLPEIPLVAAGGVTLTTAEGYLAAGASALGIGEAVLPWEAVALRQSNRIGELARRFLKVVGSERTESIGIPGVLASATDTSSAKHAELHDGPYPTRR